MSESNTVTSAWLPDFIDWLKEAGQPGKPRLHAECSICLSMLDISTDVGDMVAEVVREGSHATLVADLYAQKQLEPAAVLACGHVIGSQCLREYIKGGHKRCPICRQDVACSKCKRIVPTPQCTPLRDPIGHYGFRPYEAILDKIPWTDGEKTGGHGPSTTKRYCGACVSQQGMFLMNSTFIRNEKCLLCSPKSIYHKPHEPEFEHRARRERMADHLFQTRVQNVCDLLFTRPGLRLPVTAAARLAEARTGMTQKLTALYRQNDMLGLKGRLFMRCGHLQRRGHRDRGGRYANGAATGRKLNAHLLGLLAWTVSHLSHGPHTDPIWFTGIDHLMAIDPLKPALSAGTGRIRYSGGGSECRRRALRGSRGCRVSPPGFLTGLRRRRSRWCRRGEDSHMVGK
ncbi:hypothetical protein PG984_006989 [Apiospora sp. TS-2023a]